MTNQSNARIPVHGLLLCTNPNTWLTPQQPFDCCSWFAATSHRNTNKIFNVGARDFAWLQNPKAYKKHSKNSFFYRRRLGFQKENLMKLSRVGFFFFPPPLNISLMGSPIPNRFTQTLGFPSPIRITQTYKQIAFYNKNIAGYNLKTCKLNQSGHLSSFNESWQIELLSRRYRRLQICTFLEQFLSSLHVFNLTTCNDHLEPT